MNRKKDEKLEKRKMSLIDGREEVTEERWIKGSQNREID